jgi:hypothetical protein
MFSDEDVHLQLEKNNFTHICGCLVPEAFIYSQSNIVVYQIIFLTKCVYDIYTMNCDAWYGALSQ